MNTNRSTICVHEHAAERNANVCLTVLHVSKGKWERKIMNKENKLVIRILKRILLLVVVMFLLSVEELTVRERKKCRGSGYSM